MISSTACQASLRAEQANARSVHQPVGLLASVRRSVDRALRYAEGSELARRPKTTVTFLNDRKGDICMRTQNLGIYQVLTVICKSSGSHAPRILAI